MILVLNNPPKPVHTLDPQDKTESQRYAQRHTPRQGTKQEWQLPIQTKKQPTEPRGIDRI